VRHRLAVAALMVAGGGLIVFILALFDLVGWGAGGAGLVAFAFFGLAGSLNLSEV
jgi:hypothetical protein